MPHPLARTETRAEDTRYGPPLRTFANTSVLRPSRNYSLILRPGLPAKCPPCPKILFKTPYALHCTYSKRNVLGPVSRKSRKFSGAFRVTYFSFYLQNEGASSQETLQLF